MLGTDDTEMIQTGIEQLLSEVDAQMNSTSDLNKQLNDISVVVNNFVNQTFQVVSDEEDLQLVNEQLINSLIQIKDFVASRPNQINIAMMKLQQRKVAYEQCLILANEAKNAAQEAEQVQEAADEEPTREVEEPTREVVDDEKKRRIMEGMDESGRYITRRKIGGRPERLKDIRNVEAELKSQNYREEDI